jgi:putative transposase
MGLAGWMTKQRYPGVEQIQRLPIAFLQGTLKHLAVAWAAYKDKKLATRYIPKFKGRGESLDTLYTLQPEAISIEGNKVKCPGSKILGSLKVVNKGLTKRWTGEARNLKICKRPSGYYLQLTADIPPEPLKESKLASGLDVGLQFIYADDAGKVVKPPKYYRQAQEKLARIQRKIDHKRRKRTLKAIQTVSVKELLQKVHHFGKNIAEAVVKARPKTWKALIATIVFCYPQPKNENEADRIAKKAHKKAIDLKFKLTEVSNRQRRINKKLSRQHEKVKMQRKAFHHKLSTYLVRTFAAIAVESIQLTNLIRRPKAKKREDGKGYEQNNATRKAGMNKSFADASLGMLLSLIQSKIENWNKWVETGSADPKTAREFVEVAPHYTSQDCPECGHRQKKSLSQRTHRCSECGYVAPRDVAAARNIRSKANFVRMYAPCSAELKPVDLDKVPGMNQEASRGNSPQGEAYHRDSVTTFKSSFSEFDNQEVLETGKQQNQSQTFATDSFQMSLPLNEVAAPPEILAHNEIDPPQKRKQKRRKSISNEERVARPSDEAGIQLELSLWDTSLEISSEDG